MATTDFQLSEELLKLQQGESPFGTDMDPTGQNPKDLMRQLEDLIKALSDSPAAIIEEETFDQLAGLLTHFHGLTGKISRQVVETLVVGFQQELDLLKEELPMPGFLPGQHTEVVERLAYLSQMLVNAVITKATAKSSDGAGSSRTGGSRRSRGAGSGDGQATSTADLPDNWNQQSVTLWKCVRETLGLRLNKLWSSTAARDTVVGVFCKISYQMLEHPPFTKNADLKRLIYQCLGTCVQSYNHTFVAKTTIMQNLQHYEHLSDIMAELVVACFEQFDAVQLVDEVLRDVAGKDFSNAHDRTGPKSFGRFLVHLSELSPKAILKQMGFLVRLLDSEIYMVRTAMVEVMGNLILYLTDLEANDVQRNQIAEYFDLLEQRFRDNHFNSRGKVLQVCIKLSEGKAKFPKQRPRLIDLIIGRCEDKTSNVRKYAIRALTSFLQTHPFSLDGGPLVLTELAAKLSVIEEEIRDIANRTDVDTLTQQLRPGGMSEDNAADQDEAVALDADAMPVDSDDATSTSPASDVPSPSPNSEPVGGEEEMAVEGAPDPVAPIDEATVARFMQLQLQKRYYKDALRFAYQLQDAIPILSQLLGSTNKAEVMEAMDFFVTAYHYRLEQASDGIRKMVHLVWTKDNASDEAKGVKTKLLDCYHKIYLMPRPDLSARENVNQIVRNLIGLTANATLADLTSLEELLGCMVREGGNQHIAEPVVAKLWSVYAYTKRDLPRQQRRGAIVVLGMLAQANKRIVADNIDALLRVGLGALGRDDLVLAKYTCIALQCLGPSRKRVKGMADDAHPRYARDHPVISQLQNIVQDQLESPDWFPLAEQAINAIYSLSEQPDVVCTEIIHRKTGEVLQTPNRKAEAEPAKEAARADPVAMDADSDADDDVVIPNLDPTDEVDTDPAATPTASATASAAPLTGSAYPLCQLVFLVGHVAIKQIILLEIIEAELKRRKGSDGAKKTPSKGDKGDEDELEQVTGTTEDEVADTINHIRERELLYGPTSLLARYGPLVAHLCSNAKAYPAPALLAQATLALSKLMCVSSAFCETHLPLLMSVLTQSQTPAIRSNIIIALGDITVCFNNLIGENVEYLYGPLHDSDRAVKKNTLMVLTHLVLNGMIKAKGQLGEMAKCLEDPDQRISDLAKLFFTELATKDNYLYNNLPDMISTLSTGLNAVTEAAFARIMKFLFEFIKDKDKQVENIAEKLCQRFRSNDDPRQWRDIAHCLSLMPYRSERSFKRLVDNFPYYYDKLGDSVVYKCLCDVVTRARAPGIQKAEFKALVDEFEAKVKDARIKCTGELETKEGNEGEHEGGAETVVADMATDHDGTAAGGPHHRDASPPRPSRKRAPNTPGSVLKANPTLAKPRGRGRATGRTVKFSAKKQRNAALWDTSSDEEEADEVEEDHHDDDDNRDDDDDPNDDISDMDDDEGATKDAPEDPFMDEDPAPRSKRGTSRSRRSAASVVSPSAAVVHVDIPPPPEFTTGTRRSSRRSTRLSKDAVPVSTRNSRRRMVESDDDNDMDEDE